MEHTHIQNDMSQADETDEDLLLAAREGSARAFEALVRRYETQLFRFCYRMLQDVADAEEVFEETFLRVYRQVDRFQESNRFRPWVYHIATRLCRARLRKRHQRREMNHEGNTASPEGARPCDAQIVDASSRQLEAAVARLRPKHRAVFLMARYEGLSYSEIAHALRIPVGMVKSRMNKAVTVLRKALLEEQE